MDFVTEIGIQSLPEGRSDLQLDSNCSTHPIFQTRHSTLGHFAISEMTV
jgi:hypothetical protein